jgi:type III secretory pathway component EscS
VVFVAAPWAGSTLLRFAESLFNAVFS